MSDVNSILSTTGQGAYPKKAQPIISDQSATENRINYISEINQYAADPNTGKLAAAAARLVASFGAITIPTTVVYDVVRQVVFGCSAFVPDRSLPDDAAVGDAQNDSINPEAGRPDAGDGGLPDTIIPDGQTDGLLPDTIQNDGQTDGIPSDAIQTDGNTDGPPCTWNSVVETAFSAGYFNDIDNTSMQLDVNNSSIFLERDWTGVWHAENGLPTAATPAWTAGGAGTPPSAIIQDPVSLESALNIDTYTAHSHQDLYYSIGPAFTNSSGWAAQWRVRLNQSDNSGSECALDVIDGVWEGRVGLTSSTVAEITTGNNYSFDPKVKMNTYRFEGKGNGFRVYLNEQLQIFGNFNTSFASAAQAQFGDLFLNQDGNCYWNKVAWYNGSDHVPYKSTGQYFSQVYDVASANNNIGNGAYIDFSGTVNDPITAINYETRTGNTPIVDASWSNWQAATGANVIASPANRYLQIKTTLQTLDTAQTAIVNDQTIHFCTY